MGARYYLTIMVCAAVVAILTIVVIRLLGFEGSAAMIGGGAGGGAAGAVAGSLACGRGKKSS